jgi:hypothetical protein
MIQDLNLKFLEPLNTEKPSWTINHVDTERYLNFGDKIASGQYNI